MLGELLLLIVFRILWITTFGKNTYKDMISNEQLMQQASQGNRNAFKDLYSYAGSGNAEAQYYLALYYKETKGSGQILIMPIG